MGSTPLRLAVMAAVLFAGAPAVAHPGHDDAPHAHQTWHLFRPTPPGAMRPLSTDRPDRTESPYSVDPGHLQIELDLAAWTRDRSAGARHEGWSAGVANLKLGLVSRADLQLVVESWLRERAEFPGLPRETRSGFGDVTARLKVNLFGNDGGRAALAVMPFAAFPTAGAGLGRDDVEVGLIVPYARDLPGRLGLGTMAEIDVTLGDPRAVVWVGSATLARDLTGALGGYVELFGAWPSDAGQPVTGTFDLGLTLGIGRDLQLDGGANLGLTDATEDVTLFLGFTVRR